MRRLMLFILITIVLTLTGCDWNWASWDPPEADKKAMENLVLQYMQDKYHISFEIIDSLDDHTEGWGYEDNYFTADIKLQNSESDGYNEMHGSSGNDTFTGGEDIDKIWGGDGSDVMNGGNGNNEMYGGDGDDYIYGGNDDDYIEGGNGDDHLYGGNGVNTIYGGAGNDIIYSGDHGSFLYGGDGDDRIYAGGGADVLDGGTGNDYLQGDHDGDTYVFGMTGRSHTEPGGKAFALAVMKFLNDKCAAWRAETNISFSLYGTPMESVTYKFSQCLQRKHGIIPHVTDKNYITNSYHVNVTEPIDAFSKLTFESEFQELSPGGAISYVEVPNMQHNIPAVLALMEH